MTPTAIAPWRPQMPRPPFVPQPRQLDASLFCELIAEAPSRQNLVKGSYPREDLRENLLRLYDALWRHSHATRTAAIATTWEQLQIAVGYDVDHKNRASRQVKAWMGLLREVGLVAYTPGRDRFGATRRLEVTLLVPDPVRIAAIEARLKRATGLEPATYSLEGCRSTNVATPKILRRRRECPKQREKNRRQPWRRKAGRGVAVPRFVASECLIPSPLRALGEKGGKPPSPQGDERKGETRARAGGRFEPDGRARAAQNGSTDGGGSKRCGVPELRPLVRQLERGFFDRLRQVDGIELQTLQDTRALEYALQRLDRYADGGTGQQGAGAAVAMGLIDQLAEDLLSGQRPPSGLPRHLGVLWPELHRLGFRWRANAKRRRVTQRDCSAGSRVRC